MAHARDRIPPCVFVRDLPMGVRLRLRSVLDSPNSPRNWKALAAEMDYRVDQVEMFNIAYFRLNGSPTLELLQEWGTHNKTVDELVVMLEAIDNVEAIEAIFDGGSADDSLPPVQVSTAQQLPPDVDLDDMRSVQEILLERRRADETDDMSQRLHTEPQTRVNQPRQMHAMDMPAVEVPPGRSEWPLKPGALRTALIRVERDAAKKAGIAVVDYEKLKVNANRFAERTVPKGGSRLGAGGYGNVFFLEMTRHGHRSQVACKRMHQAMSDENAVLQFINELAVLTMIQVGAVKNNVEDVLRKFVELKGFSVNGACPCLIYEYVPFGSLLKAVRGEDKTHKFKWTDRHNVAAQVSEALVYMHVGQFGSPIIHGDVKSANILLDEQFNAKLGDFGVARVLADDSSVMHPERQVLAGTNAYMAPEARRGCLSAKSDAYSFGIVLFELLTGKKAYDESRTQGQEDLKSYMVEQVGCLDDLVLRAYVNLDPDDAWPKPLYMNMYDIGRSCVESKLTLRRAISDVTDDLQRLTKPYAKHTVGRV